MRGARLAVILGEGGPRGGTSPRLLEAYRQSRHLLAVGSRRLTRIALESVTEPEMDGLVRALSPERASRSGSSRNGGIP